MRIWRKSSSVALRAANFLANYHHLLIIFVLSTFLSTFVGEKDLSLVIAASSFVMMICMSWAPRLFTTWGSSRTLTLLGILEILVLYGLSQSQSPAEAVLYFMLQGSLTYSIFVGLDLLLEAETRNEKKTGNARGGFLMITNAAAVIATLTLSQISVGEEYARVFLTAAGILVPFTLLAAFSLPKISHALAISNATFLETLASLTKRTTPRTIMLAHFLLQLFFTWMVVYTPFFLHVYIGFPWPVIGAILMLAMLPYIILEYPLGIIADRWIGEKELLIVGFLILGISTITISYLDGAGFFAWILLMIATRIGGAMVEITTETHFFRLVDENDSGTISLFRMLRPASAVVGPIIAGAALMFVPFSSLFVVFGVILLLGIPLAAGIRDSR